MQLRKNKKYQRRNISGLQAMRKYAQEVAAQTAPGDVIALVGELGSGKTTFVQYLANALGVNGRVTSPTFLMMRMYPVVRQKPSALRNIKRSTDHVLLTSYDLRLVHIDAYRIKDPRELEMIGALEYIGASNAITVIEWADRVKEILPTTTRWIAFAHGKNARERSVVIF